MTTAPSDLHSAWARWFVSALADSGLRDVIISPGSRSTPLALAAAECPRVRCLPVVDERVAAFIALGQARLTGLPSMLLCTSGTAGAHYLPALIEAAQANVPVLVVTTDRPWEAYDCASPQTVDQTDLFGRVVRHRAELGLPDAAPEALAAAGRIAAQCLALARAPTPGPVHVNARFRKPLEPVAVAAPEPWSADLARRVALGAPRVFTAECIPSAAGVAALVDRLAHARRPLFVCGPTLAWGATAHDALFALAAAVGAPVAAAHLPGAHRVDHRPRRRALGGRPLRLERPHRRRPRAALGRGRGGGARGAAGAGRARGVGRGRVGRVAAAGRRGGVGGGAGGDLR
jgi:2-succinyl-5-enolpyruvyl-6-hydroxy-3-cyclohexene-1-carboxylate synthase